MTIPNKKESLIELIREKGSINAAEVIRKGFPYIYLTRLVKEGILIRISRGVYELAEPENISEHHSLVAAATAVPNGKICLLSALVYHNIGTQMPNQVWVAIDRKQRVPKVTYPPIRFVKWSSKFFKTGIESYEIEGKSVSITTPARTVADCFKYRNDIGLEAALEAMRDGLNQKLFTRDELAIEAKHCRVWNVLRPYLEATI